MREAPVPGRAAGVGVSPRLRMSAHRSRFPWAVLLGLVLVGGVMAMHGLQASTGPANTSGLPAVNVESATTGHAESGDGENGHGKPSGGSHNDRRHSGGEICLALLTLAGFALLLRATSRAWLPVIRLPRSVERPRPKDAGRSPPPLAFRSAVLRL